MSNSFNKLKVGEDERLSLLAEECAEVIQIIQKIQRHGYQSSNPYDPKNKTNRYLLEEELGHVYLAIGLMCSKEDISREVIIHAKQDKKMRINKYLHHNKINLKKAI